MVAAILGGCASTPAVLEGNYATLTPADADNADLGTRVRWGGHLLEVRPEAERTCFEILSHPLGATARPRPDAPAGRRFIACRAGFSDPAAFPTERLVTVTGTIDDFTRRPIGGYVYRFPLLAADTVYLWAESLPPRPYAGPPLWWHDHHRGLWHRHPHRW